MSKRTSKIAELDHAISAVVVEVQDEEIFHFRQLQFDEDTGISDLGKYYNETNVIKPEYCVAVFGDSHVGSHDLDLHVKLEEIIKECSVDEIILHDIFDAQSITHHDIGRPAVRACKALKDQSSLAKEAVAVAEYLNTLSSWTDTGVTVVKSNHDEALDKYLTECRFVNDPVNLYYALELTQKFIEGKDPLEYMVSPYLHHGGTKVKWLKRDEDYKIAGIVECGCHGDLGANGARGSARTVEKAYGNAVVGHSHTGAVFRDVFCVGTSSYLKMSYNKGCSSWTQTLCLIYPNATKQLINCIKDGDNKYTWRVI
jgi:hypothetical protein